MALFPPIRVGSGFNGGRPLKNGAAGVLKRATLSLTVAQMQAAQATAAGYTIIPAVAGSIIVPLFMSWDEDRQTAFTSTPTFQLSHASDNSIVLAITIGMQAGATAPVKSFRTNTAPANAQQNFQDAGRYIGDALNFRLNAALTGAGTYNRNALVTVLYWEIPVAT